MTKQAVVQGEYHTNPDDAKRLLRNAEDAEILYVEGRSDTIQLESKTFRYAFFLIGYFLLELLYASNSLVEKSRGKGFDIREEAEKMGLDTNSEIDLELHEIFDKSEGALRFASFVVSVLTFLLGVFLTLLNQQTVWLLFVYDGLEIAITYGFIGMIICISSPFVYLSSIIILILPLENIRDKKLASSVTEHATQNGFDNVAVLIGDSHVPGVKEELENNDWLVTTHRSQALSSRLWRTVGRFRKYIGSTVGI